MRPTRAALTLIELLVVVAIVSALLSLLIPAALRAREAANRARCLDNLKQAGLALQAHHNEKGSLPPGDAYRDNHGTWVAGTLLSIGPSSLAQVNKMFGGPLAQRGTAQLIWDGVSTFGVTPPAIPEVGLAERLGNLGTAPPGPAMYLAVGTPYSYDLSRPIKVFGVNTSQDVMANGGAQSC